MKKSEQDWCLKAIAVVFGILLIATGLLLMYQLSGKELTEISRYHEWFCIGTVLVLAGFKAISLRTWFSREMLSE